jgi:hypothetical protein
MLPPEIIHKTSKSYSDYLAEAGVKVKPPPTFTYEDRHDKEPGN